MAHLIRTRRLFLVVIASPLIAMLAGEVVQKASVRLAWNSAFENGSARPAADFEPLCHNEPPYTPVPDWVEESPENPFGRLAKTEWQQELRDEDFLNLKDAEFAYRLRYLPGDPHRDLPNTKLSRTYLLVSSDKVTYRSIRLPNRGSMIFFEPGTAKPVAYAGDLGECLFETEHTSEDRCDYYQDHKLEVHGFAWPGETEAGQSPRRLSQERIRRLKAHLDETALPSDVTESTAHGIWRTRARTRLDQPVVGLTFDLYVGTSSLGLNLPRHTPRAYECQTTQWNERLLGRLIRFTRNYFRPTTETAIAFDGFHTVVYRRDNGDIAQSGPNGIGFSDRQDARSGIGRWTRRIRASECNLDPPYMPHDIQGTSLPNPSWTTYLPLEVRTANWERIF